MLILTIVLCIYLVGCITSILVLKLLNNHLYGNLNLLEEDLSLIAQSWITVIVIILAFIVNLIVNNYKQVNEKMKGSENENK